MYLVGFPVVLIALRPDSEWAISVFAFILVMVFCQIFGFTKIDFSWEELMMAWLILGMISIFLGYYVLMSRDTKKALAVQQNKLSNMNNELEKQVALRTKELQEANDKLALDITLDPVTGIMNKRTFMEKLRNHIEKFRLDSTRFSIIVFDIDNFYQINHGYGRRVGDEILTKIAAMTVKNSLPVDTVARVAGDEFALMLHDVPYEKAVERAERIREHLEWAVFVDHHQVTASFGVVEFNEKNKDIDEHIVMHQVDLALQKAKHRGKNRIC
jgi:diguanylate cyclase (GGDEF)-like protein